MNSVSLTLFGMDRKAWKTIRANPNHHPQMWLNIFAVKNKIKINSLCPSSLNRKQRTIHYFFVFLTQQKAIKRNAPGKPCCQDFWIKVYRSFSSRLKMFRLHIVFGDNHMMLQKTSLFAEGIRTVISYKY